MLYCLGRTDVGLISSGANTGVVLNKLVDAGATFVADGVQEGMIVFNTTQGTSTFVTNVDGQTSLTLNDDRFTAFPENYSVNGVDLGEIQTDSAIKDSGLMNIPLPLSDSSSLESLDILGATKSMTIGGLYIGQIADLRLFLSNMEGFITGQQNVGGSGTGYSIFHSYLEGKNMFVKIVSFDRNWIAGNPLVLEYTLRMIEVSTTL